MSMIDTDRLIQQLAELPKLHEENRAYKRKVRDLERSYETLLKLTSAWNVIVVMGQVQDVVPDGFSLKQGEQTFSIEADHKLEIQESDVVLVSGNLHLLTYWEDPPTLEIKAHHVHILHRAKEL